MRQKDLTEAPKFKIAAAKMPVDNPASSKKPKSVPAKMSAPSASGTKAGAKKAVAPSKTASKSATTKTTAAKKPVVKKATGKLGVIANPASIKPGQKKEIKLELARELMQDVSEQIDELHDALNTANALSNFEGVKKIKGLYDNLMALRKNIDAEIKDLESRPSGMPDGVKKLFEKINQDCRQYIAQARKANAWLYRGSRGSPDQFMGRSWDARRTLDSDKYLQEVFDKFLAAQGFRALRGNSIFATSNPWHATNFGEPYIIFPLDGHNRYTYTASEDLTLESDDQIPIDKTKFKNWKKQLIAVLEKLWDQGNKNEKINYLRNSLESDYETWGVLGDVRKLEKPLRQAGVPEKLINPGIEQFMHIKAFNTEYKPKQTDLALAIKNGREVYISGTYYALSVYKYGQFIDAYWNVPVEVDL